MGADCTKMAGAVVNLTNYEQLPLQDRIIYSLLRPDDSRKNDSRLVFPESFLPNNNTKEVLEPSRFAKIFISIDLPTDYSKKLMASNTQINCDLLWALLFNQVRFPTSYKGSQKNKTLEERITEILQLATMQQKPLQMFRPVTDFVVQFTVQQPSSFGYLMDNYQSLPFSIFKPLLEHIKKDEFELEIIEFIGSHWKQNQERFQDPNLK